MALARSCSSAEITSSGYVQLMKSLLSERTTPRFQPVRPSGPTTFVLPCAT